jgi:hypothetical protein
MPATGTEDPIGSWMTMIPSRKLIGRPWNPAAGEAKEEW